MSDLRAALEAVVPASRVSVQALDRVRYASDASCYRLVPRAVVHAASIDEVRRLFETSRAQRVPLVFRAAGTSLSGQAVTDGVLVEVARHWRGLAVEQDGMRVRVQPGVIGAAVNAALRRYGRRMGPDPASIDACMMGGILANNSSGMCCGVRDNAYHTLASMTMVLPDGRVLDSARDGDTFAHSALGVALARLADEVRRDGVLVERIRRKYAIKNTMGYSLNAFLDETEPIRIMARLMIGSEGTLGFIAEAVLRTVPDPPLRVTGLLTFASVTDACAAVPVLEAAGASAVELMDRACLRAVEGFPGVASFIADLGPQAATLLVESQALDTEEQVAQADRLRQAVNGLALVRPPDMATDDASRLALWKIRKGIIAAVGARRPAGSTVIIEDVAVPTSRLAEAVDSLQRLFTRHGYGDAGVLGHARDGNLHFVVTPSFSTHDDVERYRVFLEDVVELVLSRGGSLKAEHGTGRNMAPFVEREWGAAATSVMRRLKSLVDPDNLLNPGVLLTDDAQAHVRHLKDIPAVSPVVDACIECGFCERVCPSRDITMTPRQRIVTLREQARGSALGEDARAAFGEPGLETCATDGLCGLACPVGIDTGRMVKALRAGEGGVGPGATASLREALAGAAARRWTWVERGARWALAAGHLLRAGLGVDAVNAVVSRMERPLGMRLPRWVDPMPRAASVSPTVAAGRRARAEFVLVPSCLSRIMGPPCVGEEEAGALLERLSARAAVRLWRPPHLAGVCCGMPLSSKGHPRAARALLTAALARLDALGIDPRTPLVVDASSCLVTFREEAAALGDARVFLDAVEYARDVLLPRLSIRPLQAAVAIHPPCSLVRSGRADALIDVVKACAVRAEVPLGAACCGMAGDRGLLYPQLPRAATAAEAEALRGGRYARWVSSNATCEMGLRQATGFGFRSFLSLLDEASSASTSSP